MSYDFTLPTKVIIGDGALENSGKELISFGKKAFIVTGKVVTKLGTVKLLTDVLEKQNIDYVIFNDIIGEPTDVMIDKGVNLFKETKCDFCIGIGGGSPLDSGKAIVAMTKLKGKISDYMGKMIEGKFPPLVLIPTTAGTGSETTKFTVITDTENDVKMLLKGDALLPKLAIIDYEMTKSAPRSVTAATGMDALTHAIEAYTSKRANPLTDTYAISAIKRIFKYLPQAYEDGNNENARKEMALAAFEAGVCINNSSVTIVHGMSRPIGAMFHVPHGISNAMIIKECLEYVVDGCYEKFGNIGRQIKVATDENTDVEATKAFLNALADLCNTCKIPTLNKYGINKSDFDKLINKMSEDAINSGSPANTVKEINKDDVIEIYKRLW